MSYRLRPFDLVMLVISLVFGMGIFRTPATVAATVDSEFLYYLAWLLGGVIALLGALTFAEIGRLIPDTGAYYRVFARAYHPVLAFGINVIIVVSNAASAAGVSIIGAEYVRDVVPGLDVRLAGCAFILVILAVNLAGLRASIKTQNVLIGTKLLLLGVIIAAPFILPEAAQSPVTYPISGHTGVWGFGLALVAVAFTYGGYQQTINFGGDAPSDGRTVSRSIVVGVIVVTSLYLLATWAYASIIGFADLAGTPALASAISDRLFGPIGQKIVTVVMLISVFGYVNVTMLSNPRVISAMADDGMLPRSLNQTDHSQKKNVSGITIILFALLSMSCIYLGESFERILGYTMFLDSIGMATAAAALFVITRRSSMTGATSYRPTARVQLAAALFIASYLFIAAAIAADDPPAALYGLVLLVSVMGLRLFSDKWRHTRDAK